MDNVKDIDDLYSGYNDDNPALMDAVRSQSPTHFPRSLYTWQSQLLFFVTVALQFINCKALA